ncbi:BREX-2 system phosphatase PglZ [Mycolicibacterium sphagni]|uniref:BREX-2 system phosphatase PglZ n=1 Tax=Mycolicibacterium sphagni TaxID=1786 RepID=A0ABX2JX55_9MYCO|nr:BREX-2 system phosphatase PglZ [Mycolicibacterium sphagni]NTY62304.1 BREX-2 system phosphatase PglZ [Mycolicibacterium sphagni]
MTTVTATEPVIRARLKKAREKNYANGVLGLRAKATYDGSDFDYDGTPVTVAPCPSVLAIWEAIDGRDPNGWTVVLTSVDDDDLGDTVLAHLLDGRLITPDPWDALRSNFSATTIEPALYRTTNDRAIANGLLATLSADAYIPAPGGVLTRDHAMATLARDTLGIVKDVDVEIDTLAVLEWSRSSDVTERVTALNINGGPELSAAFYQWLAGRSGRLAAPVAALLPAGRISELVALGIVAGVFDGTESVALGKFLVRSGLSDLSPDSLQVWYQDTYGLVTNSLKSEQQQAVLSAAGTIISELGISEAATSSDLLPHGLEARLVSLSNAITAALPDPLPSEVDSRLVSEEALRDIENRWEHVQQHFLASTDRSAHAFGGAVRLARHLATGVAPTTGLAPLADRHLRTDSWVDSALVVARRGADQPVPAAALRALIDIALARRARHDRAFATALADAPTPSVQTIENVMRDTVIPIAKNSATLLLVIDALSVAAANDLVRSMQQHGWTEVSANNAKQRGVALAVLPTLTQRSRCSLLCGELREGTSDRERTGFLSLLRESGLEATGGVPDPIFHKKALDAVPSGAQLATDIRNAIADTDRQKLVAVVLNYVDDTLHHTDPGGTDWTLQTITHLAPLLAAAKNAGRTVVITSDHGHIIEYGTSAKVARANTYGQRAHGDLARVDPDREVVVRGPRVLTESQQVVLAVDETIRYEARNAGYHGGATPAEAIVPVVALVAGELFEGASRVVGTEPYWWHAGSLAATEIPPDVSTKKSRKPAQDSLGLFDDPAHSTTPASGLPGAVLRSKVFAEQMKRSSRIALREDQIQNLLQTLLATSAREITLAQAAAALGVETARAKGALMQAKPLLDVEGYEVLRVDRDVVRLDVEALKEQFGISE